MANTTEKIQETADVIIIGAGAVGLLSAYGLQRFGISTIVVERDDKASWPMYGRACTLYPRTIEMLDQYGLLDKMNQIGFIARSSATFDQKGERVAARGWHTMYDAMSISYLDYILNIRLKYSEDIFRAEYLKAGGKLLVGWELKELQTDDAASDDLKVTATIENIADKSERLLKSRYLVGADGGHSTVRKLAGMPSERMPTEGPGLQWIRIDGVVKTNIPDSDMGYCAIESPTHGQVLWCNLDHGVTRIGYSLPPEKAKVMGKDTTEAQAIEEACNALAPWKLEFERVDWFTNYDIHQSVAKEFIKGRIIVAGDACHTHSSGLAQGMNTGVHDAVNLAWKLAGVLKGWFNVDVLKTYALERRAAAQHLVELDVIFSKLVSGIIPEKYKHVSDDPNVIYEKVFEKSMQFNIGLGVNYDENIINRRPIVGNGIPGHRAPDVLVYSPGSRIPTRLQSITPNNGNFWAVVFTGEPAVAQQKIESFRAFVSSSKSLQKMQTAGIFRFLTVIGGNRSLAYTALGGEAFGDAYYDQDLLAHRKYGFSMQSGGVAILRPDGTFGFGFRLDAGHYMEEYFSKVVKAD